MGWWHGMADRVASLLCRRRVEREMDEEMRFHLEMEAEKLLAAGAEAEDARREARRRFGGVERMKERTRDERGTRTLEDLVRDLRFGARSLRRAPGATAVAVLTLGLGIGATTAMFSVVHGVLIRPLPYPDAGRMVAVWELSSSGEPLPASYLNFADWRRGSGSLEALAAFTPASPVTVVTSGGGVRATVTRVSADFFRVAGVPPALGRTPAPDEHRPGGVPVAVVSHDFWGEVLRGPAGLAGSTLDIQGTVHEVVGVMPEGFRLPAGADVWVSLDRAVPWTVRGNHVVRVVGRLARGATVGAAASELERIHADIRASSSEVETVGVRLRPYRDEVVGDVRSPLVLLLGAASFLLLVACTNVAGAQLARGLGRRHELAVRASLGAGRGRLVRQLLTESLLVASLGGVGGVVLARLLLGVTVALDPSALPRLGEVGLDGSVLAFGAGVVVATTLLFGLLPAVQLTDASVGGVARSGRRRSGDRRAGLTGRVLMAGEVALALVLVAGAGLMARSLAAILGEDVGFRAEGVTTGDIHLPAGRYDTAEEAVTVLGDVLASLGSDPAVEEAGLGLLLPVRGAGSIGGPVLMEDGTRSEAIVQYRVADAGYFRTLGIPLVRGRLFEGADATGAPHVAVVDEAMAARLWPGEDPLGKRFNPRGMDPYPDEWLTVVGVVGGVRSWGQGPGGSPTYYVHYRQRPAFVSIFGGSLVARGDDPAVLAPALREAVRSVDDDVPLRVRTLSSRIAGSASDHRFSAFVLGAFGLVALLLAAVGVYGVVAFSVARRTREIGIRVALGARPARVRRRIVGETVATVAVGLAVGLGAAFALAGVVRGSLHGIAPMDPSVHGTAVAVVLGAALLASWLPARRGTRVDPTVALRGE